MDVRGIATLAVIITVGIAAGSSYGQSSDAVNGGSDTNVVTIPARSAMEMGRRFIEENCSHCHAVGTDDTSPVEGAVAFRNLSRNYPVDSLAEALAEGIVTGHPAMPEFVLEPDQIEAVIGYLQSIQTGN